MTDHMRAKVRQIIDECHWSTDKFAHEIGVDTFALRRWMMAAPPETRRHLHDLIDCEHKVEAFLASYTGPNLVPVVNTKLHRGGSHNGYTGKRGPEHPRRKEYIPEWLHKLQNPVKVTKR